MRALPRWREISEDLVRRLQRGEYADGFPGELALAEEYQVSRGTIRRALGPLREQGIVGGSPGRQSYVIDTSREPGFGPMYSLRDAITADGTDEHSEVLAQKTVTSREVSMALGLDPTTTYVHVTRVRYADGVPFATDRTWIVAAVAEPVLEADLSATSIYEVLRTHGNVEFDAGVEHTRAEPAAGEVADRLGIEEGTPVLSIRRKSCLAGEPVELRDTQAVGDGVTLTHVFGDASAVLDCHGNTRPIEIP